MLEAERGAPVLTTILCAELEGASPACVASPAPFGMRAQPLRYVTRDTSVERSIAAAQYVDVPELTRHRPRLKSGCDGVVLCAEQHAVYFAVQQCRHERTRQHGFHSIGCFWTAQIGA